MRKLSLAAFCLFAAVQTVSAAVTCTGDRITKVVAHPDGNLYFLTRDKCPNDYCMIAPTWQGVALPADVKNRIFQGIIDAYRNQDAVSVYWPTQSNCSAIPAGTLFTQAQYFDYSRP